MAEMYAARGVPVGALRSASARYAQWLLDRKKDFNRKRSLRQEDLEQETRALFARGAGTLLANEKLAHFLRRVALERNVMDYVSLSLSGHSEITCNAR